MLRRMFVSGPPQTGPAPVPAGLISTNYYRAGTPVVAPAVLADRRIKGLELVITWSAIAAAPARTELAPVRALLRDARAARKFAVLTLVPGAARVPWAQGRLHRWFVVVARVARRFASDRTLRMVDVAGPAPSASTSLPGAALRTWRARGYTSVRYVAAWAQAFATYHRLFPHQYLSLTLADGLPLGARGRLDPSQVTATPLAVIAAAKRYGSSLVLESGGLGAAGVPQTPFALVQAACPADTATIGFQSSGTPSASAADAAAQAGASFLEVPQSDVLAWRLPASAGCAPLTIGVNPGRGKYPTPVSVAASAAPSLIRGLRFTDAGFRFSDAINLFENGKLIKTCRADHCTITVTPPLGGSTFTADVAPPGSALASPQTAVSIDAYVDRKSPVCEAPLCVT
jgi:hypothetical protein